MNVSQRLQELGKLVAPDEVTSIVISSETASQLDGKFDIASAGSHRLRGRGETMEVFQVRAVAMSGASQLDARNRQKNAGQRAKP